MILPTEYDALERRHVAVVAAPGHSDVLVIRQLIVGRVEIHPADIGQEYREPSMRSVGADQFFLARRGQGFDVAADVACRQTVRADAADGEVGEVLADAAPVFEHVLQRRGQRGEFRVEDEVAMNSLHEVVYRFHQRAPRREGGVCISGQLRVGRDERRIQRVLAGIQDFRPAVLPQDFPDRFPGRALGKIELPRLAENLHFADSGDAKFAMRFRDREIGDLVAEKVLPDAVIRLGGRDLESCRDQVLLLAETRQQPRLVIGLADGFGIFVFGFVGNAVAHAGRLLQ